jgi:hypothetical protein
MEIMPSLLHKLLLPPSHLQMLQLKLNCLFTHSNAALLTHMLRMARQPRALGIASWKRVVLPTIVPGRPTEHCRRARRLPTSKQLVPHVRQVDRVLSIPK